MQGARAGPATVLKKRVRPAVVDDASLRVLPPPDGQAGPSSGERRAPGSVINTEIDEAFERLYHEVRAFSHTVRAQVMEAIPGDAQTRAAQNVRLARTMFGKWSLEILSALYGAQAIGFEDLRRALRGVTSSVLSHRLKMMESHGMVVREVQTTRPVRVRYGLTTKGLTVAVLGEPVFLFLQYTDRAERTNPSLAAPAAARGRWNVRDRRGSPASTSKQ